jgi:hypothetical protein
VVDYLHRRPVLIDMADFIAAKSRGPGGPPRRRGHRQPREQSQRLIRRFSSRTHRLDRSFLAEQLQGARSYRRIAGYFTSSLFEVAHEWLEPVADVRIVCNVDLSPEDLKVAQLREARMLGRWNERSIEAESLLNRERYRRLDAFLARRGQVIRVAPDSVCGFVHGKAGVIERADGRKVGFIGSMNETRHGWQQHYEILWEDDSPGGRGLDRGRVRVPVERRPPLPRRSAARSAGAAALRGRCCRRSRPRRRWPRRR